MHYADYWETVQICTYRPAESHLVEETIEHNRIDDTAHGAPRRSETKRQTKLGSEISRHNSDSGHEEGASTNPDAEPLGEETLPELIAEGQHHEAEDDEEAAEDEQVAEVPVVVDRSHDGTDEEHHQRLDGADP